MFSRGKTGHVSGGGCATSCIGADMVVAGNVETSGALHVDGTVRGDIRCATLGQGESGAVHGNIVAGEARLAGLVDGAVEAVSLTLEASARVTGDILYESLTVARGAEVEGRFRRRRPDDHGSLGARVEKAEAEAPAGLFAAPPSAVAAE